MHMPAGAMSLPVAIVCNCERRGKKLRDLLLANGVCAKLYTSLKGDILSQIDNHPAALIVDLDGSSESEQDVIDRLAAQDSVPVLFNDATCLEGHAPVMEQELGEQIAKKVFSVSAPPSTAGEALPTGYANGETHHYDRYEDEAPVAHSTIEQLWVLGASLGGPDAVKRFISRLNADVPAVFILAQHIGVEHTSLLMDQIARICELEVLIARSGHMLRHGQLVIVPMDRHFSVRDDGCVQLMSTYTEDNDTPPSIDKILASVARTFGDRSGAVIFSGIGNDGVLGARAVLENGGTLWTQAAESCVMSSMPDHVRNACPVHMDASPEALADALMRSVSDGRVNDSLGFEVANEGLFNYKV